MKAKRNEQRGDPAKMVRLKNPVTGEVKLLLSHTDAHKRHVRYGWVTATLIEFREWHSKQRDRSERA